MTRSPEGGTYGVADGHVSSVRLLRGAAAEVNAADEGALIRTWQHRSGFFLPMGVFAIFPALYQGALYMMGWVPESDPNRRRNDEQARVGERIFKQLATAAAEDLLIRVRSRSRRPLGFARRLSLRVADDVGRIDGLRCAPVCVSFKAKSVIRTSVAAAS